jgi:hypothetical protein
MKTLIPYFSIRLTQSVRLICFILSFLNVHFNSIAQSSCQNGLNDLTIIVTSDLLLSGTAIPYGTPIVVTTAVFNGSNSPRTVTGLETSFGSQLEVLCTGDYFFNGTIAQRSSFTIPPGEAVESRITLMYNLFQYGATPDITTRRVSSSIPAGGNNCRTVLEIPSRFSFVTPLGVPGQTTTVNSFTGGLGSLSIRGNVILNFNHILEPAGNGIGTTFPFIYMDEDARLIIPSGRTLELRGARVFGIRSMWNSIIVEPGGTLITGLGSDGLNTITRKTSIQDGIRAIEARDGSNINVNHTDFEDNERSIYVPPTTGALQQINFASAFPVCDFNGTGQLRPKPNLPVLNCNTNKVNGYPFAGMDINDLGSLITVISPTFNQPRTRFRNMSVGIVTKRARLLVDQARFENLHRTYSGFDGLGIYSRDPNSFLAVYGNPNQFASDLNFFNCTQGIVYENFGFNDVVDINSVHIDNTGDDIGIGITAATSNFNQSNISNCNIRAKTGIRSLWNRFNNFGQGQMFGNYIEATHPTNPTEGVGIVGFENSFTGDWRILNNTIRAYESYGGMFFYSGNQATLSNNTIILQPNSHVNSCGIFASGCSNLNASCNDILGAGLGGGAYRSGLYISGGTGSSYTCNNTNATEVGMNIIGEMRPFGMRANRFNNHSVGLVVNDAAVIGIQFLRGNKWQGPFTTGIGAENLNQNSFDILQSKFFVGSPNAPILPTYSPSNSNWFQVTNLGIDATCTSLDACPNGNPAGRVANVSSNDESFYTSAISTERMQTPNAEEMKWTVQRNAYAQLLDNPSHQNNRDKTNFIGRMRNTSTGQLYQVEKDLKDVQNIGQEFSDVLRANANSIKTLANEIAGLDAKIFMAKGAEKTALMAQKKEKNATVYRLSTENEPRHATIERKRNQELQRLMRENERISTRLQPEINEKEVNRVYLETVAQGKKVLNSEQTVTMRMIAYQCPSLGGNAVFAARSLYSLVESIKFDDLALCNARSESIQGLKVKKVVEDFKISPNPATDVLNVSQSTEKVEAGEWVFFNTAGKLLLSKKVSENEMQANMNIQGLSEGIYFVSFVVNGEKRFNQKFIKIKSN